MEGKFIHIKGRARKVKDDPFAEYNTNMDIFEVNSKQFQDIEGWLQKGGISARITKLEFTNSGRIQSEMKIGKSWAILKGRDIIIWADGEQLETLVKKLKWKRQTIQVRDNDHLIRKWD